MKHSDRSCREADLWWILNCVCDLIFLLLHLNRKQETFAWKLMICFKLGSFCVWLCTVWGGGSQGMHNSLMGCWWSVGNLNHQPFSSRLSGVSVLMVSLQLTSSTCVSTWGHVSEYFPQPLRGSLDFDCYCFFLLDSLPLFLHFLTSLIKFALQNSGEA